jgi:hypothetical protein
MPGRAQAPQPASRATQASPTRADVVETMRQLQAHLADLDRNHDATAKAGEQLAGICKGLSALVDQAVKDADAALAPGGAVSGRADRAAAVKRLRETQTSFNLQYLSLQSQISDENRKYAMVSAIMKTKHDTAKNAINNVR